LLIKEGVRDSREHKIYKNLKVIEEVFKVLKLSLGIRPIYHQEDEYIRRDIYICILALIIKQYLTFILKKHKIHSEVVAILKILSTLNVGNIYLGEEKIGPKVGRFNEEQKKVI
jgi:transposase